MREKIPASKVVGDIQDVAAELGHPPRIKDYNEIGTYSDSTVRNRFESWHNALVAAGLDPSETPREKKTSDRRGTRLLCPKCGARNLYTGKKPTFECNDCGGFSKAWHGRVVHYSMCDPIQQLASGPKLAKDVDTTVGSADSPILTLRAPVKNATKNHPKADNIAYLDGDWRAAIREFIHHNAAFIESCLKTGNNLLKENWSEEEYRLLVEQVVFMASAGEVDIDTPIGGCQ
jgi:hypothetical protein